MMVSWFLLMLVVMIYMGINDSTYAVSWNGEIDISEDELWLLKTHMTAVNKH